MRSARGANTNGKLHAAVEISTNVTKEISFLHTIIRRQMTVLSEFVEKIIPTPNVLYTQLRNLECVFAMNR